MLYYVAWGINIVQLLFRRGLQENSRNECIQSGHTTFTIFTSSENIDSYNNIFSYND